METRADELLALTGLTAAADTLSKHLSGGQKRRLALAMELVSEPPLLLCDEVTSGLDARSEREILELLRRIAREGNRVVLGVTHGLRDLANFDKVAVLSGGHLAYLGPPDTLAHYFRAGKAEDVCEVLPARTGPEGHASWVKHRLHFEEDKKEDGTAAREPAAHPPANLPAPWSQFVALLAARWKVFFRNNTGIALPPDQHLLADLCAPTWKLVGQTVAVASREEILDKIGRSPDYASAYCLALMDTPKRSIMKELGRYKNAEIVWCQEEPQNMGGWTFVQPRLEAMLANLPIKGKRPAYAGRPESAATATGSYKRHNAEQAKLLDDALKI
jgi:energy-coupling factor transporter ATP-binding protein EcfA2